MPPKVAMTITPGGLGSSNDASMAEILKDLQMVTMRQFREIMDQINIGQAAFNKKLKDINKAKVKLLEVKRFNRT